MSLYQFFKKQQHRERLKEIVHVFFEEEFGFFISKIKLHGHLPFHKRIKTKIAKEKAIDHQIRLRQAFEKLGPTFIKLGQLLSLRSDLVPPEFITEFEKMQDKVAPFPFKEAKKIIEKELKKPLDKVFTFFPEKPVASASISQVYKAKIGKKVVAVKVQRPGVENQIKEDTEIMYEIVRLMENHLPEFKLYALRDLVREFEKWTIKELNFKIEAHYAEKIAENFADSKILKIPKIYSELTTNKVLVMEFLEGIPLHDVKRIKKKKLNIRKVIKNGYFIMLKQVFIDGFFHADPHPGNILVLKDGKIGMVDFGILGHFDKKLRRYALDLFYSFVNNDHEEAVNIILRMNPDNDVNKEEFTEDVRDIFEQFYCASQSDMLVGHFIRETLTNAYKHRLRIPTDFVLYGKALATIEGLGLRYLPNFSFYNETKIILKKLLNYKFFANEAYDKTRSKLVDYGELIENLPKNFNAILKKAKDFRMTIDVEDNDIKKLNLELEHSSGNLSLGFIIAALIVASALIMMTDRSAYYYGTGFSIAGVMGLWLIKRTIFKKN